jgi:type II secretory pathway pseudopilin PulG
MRGGALLPAVLLLFIGASAALAAAGQLASQSRQRASGSTIAALAQAREALIGYAFSYPELQHDGQGIGYLPCPDKTNNGSVSLGACNARGHGAFGRFPYRTLGLPALLDGHGQCLWYAVAGSVKHNPKPLTLNWDSPGQFRVAAPSGRAISGTEHDVVAVILAPGPARPGQARPPAATGTQRCPGSANAPDDLPAFLDRPYANDISGNLDIVHGEPGTGDNDIAAWITIDELFGILRRRSDFPGMIDGILDAAATALQPHLAATAPDGADTAFFTAQAETIIGNRAHGRLPDSAALGIAPAQAAAHDNWRDQLRFVACTDGSACLTVTLADSTLSPMASAAEACRALVLFGGERLRGSAPQRRSTEAERADPGQYLEGVNHASFSTGMGGYAGYRHYAVADPHRPASEDLIRCVP